MPQPLKIYFVDSLKYAQPEHFRDCALVTPDGSVYVVEDSGDQLGGFWSGFSKIAGAIAPFAAAIPGVGTLVAAGLGLASSLTASAGNNLPQKYAGTFQEMIDTLKKIDVDLTSGTVTGAAAQLAYTTYHEQWQKFKFSVPEKEQGFLYEVEVKNFKPVWDALQTKITAAIEAQKSAAANQQLAATGSGFEFSTTSILLLVGIGFLIFRR